MITFPPSQRIQQELDGLTQQISQPDAHKNPSNLKELSRQHAQKKELLSLLQQWEQLQQQREETEQLLASDDPEMAALAEAELPQLQRRTAALAAAIQHELLPKNPLDARDVILEMRAGAGGEEAALFVSELFRAYVRYGEEHGWHTHTLHTSLSEQGGFKEVIAEISGQDIFGLLKHESGVHRVQRVPATEKMGRTHTSTITVAVLPQAEEHDIEIRPEDLRIDTYRAGGAGGQKVNKTSSAVRITHLPTNTVVAVQDERSQHKNKDKAMSILRARLLDEQARQQHEAEAKTRRSQVGTGDRSEKIRTYNFPQDRVTDHRFKLSWSNILLMMEGRLEPMFTDIRTAAEEQLLKDAADPS